MADDISTSSPQSRRIRSFVLRTGRMTSGQQHAMDELWPTFGVEYSKECVDLDKLFARHAPRMIEIGFGSGEAVTQYARMHPEMDCLGIEVHRPGAGHLLLQLQAHTINNVRISCHDAVEVLTHQIPVGSIDAIHIFFPDPWHKTRHHKRRLIQPTFADLLAQVLRVGGTLKLATDWQDYASHMRKVLDVHEAFKNVAGTAGFVDRPAHRPLTRFERRGHRLGHGVWDIEYLRK